MTPLSDNSSPPQWPYNDPSLVAMPERARRWLVVAVTYLFWLVPFSFYGFTASRGVGWLDSAMLINTVFLMKTGSWVNNHNLFLYMARLWTLLVPLDNIAFSLTLFAALFGALTVHFVFRTALLLTENLLASSLGALAVMLSHSLWWHSTSLEVYTLNTALMSLMLFLVVRYGRYRALPDLYGALFCFGLGVSNHVLMGLFLFAFLVLFLRPIERPVLWRRSVIFFACAAFLLGAQLWFTLFFEDVVRMVNETPSYGAQTLETKIEAVRYTLWRATGGRFQDRMFTETLSTLSKWRWRGNYVMTLASNFPTVAFPLAFVGGWVWLRDARHRTSALFFCAAFSVQALWSSNYFIWDMYAFGLPVWVMFGLLSSLGFDWALRRGGRIRVAVLALLPTLLLPPFLYAQVVVWAKTPGFWHDYFSLQTSSVYSAAEYFANPNKRGYTRTEDIIAGYGRTLPQGAHLWDSDSKGYYPFRMYYQRVLGNRLDVESHLVFSGFLDGEKARGHAGEMRAALDSGKRVFVSSLTFPERAVLSELYRMLDPKAPPLKQLNKMRRRDFIDHFPRYTILPVPLEGVEDALLYEIVPKPKSVGEEPPPG